ncbi:hypothetical protein [Vibrio mediterranei]|uniref:hypothetical protein n=1 Tax=Vibrio mediterranei TaxID=689 RepID=UPI0020A4ADFA|nr:hypothetical protein [Vibrio mediterranei]
MFLTLRAYSSTHNLLLLSDKDHHGNIITTINEANPNTIRVTHPVVWLAFCGAEPSILDVVLIITDGMAMALVAGW